MPNIGPPRLLKATDVDTDGIRERQLSGRGVGSAAADLSLSGLVLSENVGEVYFLALGSAVCHICTFYVVNWTIVIVW